MKKKNKELSDRLDGEKIKYRASLSASSFNDSAASRVRRGMAQEIDDLKFHFKAMNSPLENTIKELQEEITILNEKLVTERQHKEQIQNKIDETNKTIEDKVQPSQEVTVKLDDLQHEAQLTRIQLLNSFKDANYDDAIRFLPYVKNHKHLRHQFTIIAASYQVEANLLYMASWNGWLSIIKDLITKYNCNSQEEDSNGNTCLHYAAMRNHVDVMKYLFTEHSDFMAINRDGWTPLHTAAFYGHSQAVEHLLSTGKCDPLAKDNLGWTPFKLAKEFGCTDTLTILKKFGGIDCNK
ncbi:PREDICTED: E3 ubiquitin-protein ligase MIB2-like [Amphimedon queenslandica]|uniref:Uncharacterized protein n=1 Tax=Amphimedon queenslandica TaxID=400682 RepID=A0AAN0JE28_AMPQE|nr:PREDICTED: E3 ubiquitin-protein ligase MIB2-like [Amphimedon queenslandica]|eukprot:XP_019855007.1 PREDICTED: E3 ubiquitin-protein ligase MIB2-like [Amphimedon queenslandica]